MNRELRYKSHSQAVAAWIEKFPASLSKDQLIDSFEMVLTALLEKTKISVSEVTLSAVLDRVLYNSTEQYPILASVRLHGAKLGFVEFKKRLKDMSSAEIKEAFHYVTTEFFFVIGNLTAENLTPLLYRELVVHQGKPKSQNQRANKNSSKKGKKDPQ